MTNKEKYEKIFIETLGVSKEQLNEDLQYNSISQWDSIGHMTLISELEEVFDIMMDTDDIIDLNSYNKGLEIMNKYGVNI